MIIQSMAVTVMMNVFADSSEYVSDLNTLEFGSCSNKSCTSITIVDDTRLEEDELFIIQLQTSIEQLAINPSRTTVFIVNDSDGTFSFTLSHASYVITTLDMLSCLQWLW